jgi:SAM-dependent methyltransferase
VSAIVHSSEARAKRIPVDWVEGLAGEATAGTRFSRSAAREASQILRAATGASLRRARRAARLVRPALQQAVEAGERFDELASTSDELRSQMAQLAKRLDELGTRLAGQQFDATTHLAAWLENLSHKYEAISLDLRERVSPRAQADDVPEPVVLRPEALERPASPGSPLRVNLGCGERALDGYVNVDARALPSVDVVADVRRLPFDESSVDDIFSSHVIEHFRRHHALEVVLPYWRSLLRPGGTLRIITPNLAAMVARTAEGNYTLDDFAKVTYGLQEYEGDDHFAGYGPDSLERLLSETGFVNVVVIEAERRVGLGIEMEVVARKPEDR